MRRAAAEVYARNLGDATVGEICSRHLPTLFSDPDAEVRATAARCFRHLGDSDFGQHEELIRSYIESQAFPASHDGLLRQLVGSTWQLPDITLRLAEIFLERAGTEAGDISTAAAGDAPEVSNLVVRLDSQSSDEHIRSRCLGLIDRMQQLGFYGIDQQLAEHDR